MSESKQAEKWVLAGDWAVGDSQPIWADTGSVPLETVCLIPCDTDGKWKHRRHVIVNAPKTARQRDALLEAAEQMCCAISLPLTSRERVAWDALRAAITDAKGEHPWQPATSPAGVKHYRREGP